MKMYLISRGTRGVVRDLNKFFSMTPWEATTPIIFEEQELINVEDNRYSFKQGMNEYTVPASQVSLI